MIILTLISSLLWLRRFLIIQYSFQELRIHTLGGSTSLIFSYQKLVRRLYLHYRSLRLGLDVEPVFDTGLERRAFSTSSGSTGFGGRPPLFRPKFGIRH